MAPGSPHANGNCSGAIAALERNRPPNVQKPLTMTESPVAVNRRAAAFP